MDIFIFYEKNCPKNANFTDFRRSSTKELIKTEGKGHINDEKEPLKDRFIMKFYCLEINSM